MPSARGPSARLGVRDLRIGDENFGLDPWVNHIRDLPTPIEIRCAVWPPSGQAPIRSSAWPRQELARIGRLATIPAARTGISRFIRVNVHNHECSFDVSRDRSCSCECKPSDRGAKTRGLGGGRKGISRTAIRAGFIVMVYLSYPRRSAVGFERGLIVA